MRPYTIKAQSNESKYCAWFSWWFNLLHKFLPGYKNLTSWNRWMDSTFKEFYRSILRWICMPTIVSAANRRAMALRFQQDDLRFTIHFRIFTQCNYSSSGSVILSDCYLPSTISKQTINLFTQTRGGLCGSDLRVLTGHKLGKHKRDLSGRSWSKFNWNFCRQSLHSTDVWFELDGISKSRNAELGLQSDSWAI